MFDLLSAAWAALAITGAPQDAAPADTAAPARELIFRCQVRDKTSVTRCSPLDPARFHPGEAAAMITAIDQSRCATDAAPGKVAYRGIEPPRPGEPAAAYHVVTFPDWADGAAGYERATQFLQSITTESGVVVLRCDVLASGALVNCQVKSETPADRGLGATALKASARLRFRPKTIDCLPVDGGKVAVPIRFGVSN